MNLLCTDFPNYINFFNYINNQKNSPISSQQAISLEVVAKIPPIVSIPKRTVRQINVNNNLEGTEVTR